MKTVRQIPRAMRGFTLIEVAIVVAIIAVLMTLGLGFINSQVTSNSYLITKKRAELIKDALVAFLGSNRRLPCPITPTPGTAVTGEEPGSPPHDSCSDSFGVVPYATLGLSREIAEDGWGNLFSYFVLAESTASCSTGNWANPDCFGAGKKGGLKINDGTLSAPEPLADDVIAVVISHGPNGLGAYVAAQGRRNPQPPSTMCEEARNAYVDVPPCPSLPGNSVYEFHKGERTENDDVVAYVSAPEAIRELAKQGVLKSATAKANEDLQDLYDKAIWLNLGTSCAAIEPTPDGPDPWGQPYLIDFNAPPTDPTFRLCMCSSGGKSMTFDPKTCSHDPPAVCKSIELETYNKFRTLAGLSPCGVSP